MAPSDCSSELREIGTVSTLLEVSPFIVSDEGANHFNPRRR
jgi:hypothetical protein